MRLLVAVVAISVAALAPKVAAAQVYQLPTPVPQVTAANASWQMNGEPVFFAGTFYYPTGPTVFFDGMTMMRSGVYQGVPIYQDSTLEPYSIVYVPIGRNVMRPYERKRSGELAGTVGSRMPSFPIERDVELSVASGTTGIQTPALPNFEPPVIPETEYPVGTVGVMPVRRAPPIERLRPTHMQSIPAPRGNAGIWIQYEGARWYSAGPAVTFNEGRFTRIGLYHGFPVYHREGTPDVIYVPSVQDGPLAPYRK